MSTQRAVAPVIVPLSLCFTALAAPASAQLATTSPFLPANAVITTDTPAESTTIELHGVMPTPNGPLFSIYNVSRKASTLVGLNEQGSWGSTGGGTFVVRSYRQMGEQDQVTVEFQGQTQTLSTKSPKVAGAGRGGAPNAAGAAGGAAVPGGRGGGGGPGGAGGPGGGGGGPGQGGGRGGAGGPGGGGGGFAGGQGAPGGGFGGQGGGGRGGFGVAGGADTGGGEATQITANQAATLAEAVQKQQQNRAAALANPTAAATTTPTAPAAPVRGGAAAGGGGRGARGN